LRSNLKHNDTKELIQDFDSKIIHNTTGLKRSFDISKLFLPDKPIVRPHFTKDLTNKTQDKFFCMSTKDIINEKIEIAKRKRWKNFSLISDY